MSHLQHLIQKEKPERTRSTQGSELANQKITEIQSFEPTTIGVFTDKLAIFGDGVGNIHIKKLTDPDQMSLMKSPLTSIRAIAVSNDLLYCSGGVDECDNYSILQYKINDIELQYEKVIRKQDNEGLFLVILKNYLYSITINGKISIDNIQNLILPTLAPEKILLNKTFISSMDLDENMLAICTKNEVHIYNRGDLNVEVNTFIAPNDGLWAVKLVGRLDGVYCIAGCDNSEIYL